MGERSYEWKSHVQKQQGKEKSGVAGDKHGKVSWVSNFKETHRLGQREFLTSLGEEEGTTESFWMRWSKRKINVVGNGLDRITE